MPSIIVPQGNFYFYYHNWTANQQNKIHKSDCPNCNYGFGMRIDQVRGENGVWIGPFETVELAVTYVRGKLNKEPIIHACCE